MAIVLATGFENGQDLFGFDTSSGTLTSIPGQDAGRLAVELEMGGTSEVYGRLRNTTSWTAAADFAIATAWTKFSFKTDSWATGEARIFVWQTSAGSNKAWITFNAATATLSLRDSTGAVIASTVLAAPTAWNIIEAKIGTGLSAAWELRVNLVSIATGTANLLTGNNARFVVGKRNDATNVTGNQHHDDVVVSDSGFVGDARIVRLAAASAGDTFNWTTGTVADVDDAPPPDTITNIVATAINLTALVQTAAMPAKKPLALMAQLYGFCTATSATGHTVVRDTGVESTSSWGLKTAPHAFAFHLANVNPRTGLAWTAAEVNAAQVGARTIAATGVLAATVSAIVKQVIYDDDVADEPPAATDTGGIASPHPRHVPRAA